MTNVRRKDREIVKDEAYNLLKNTEYAVLATVNKDNTPYCIPFSPVVEGDFIYFHGALEGQKVENIKSNPNVCVTCIGETRLVPKNFTTEYESAVAHGICEVIEDEEEAIQGYTNALSNLKGSMTEEQYSEIEKVLNHIIEEEKEHIKEINELAVKIAETRE